MAKLSFLDKLNEQQLEYATQIAEKAQAMGIPPKLAVAIAYQESHLNPNVKVGTKGEIGGMQVMPATGEEFGYDAKALTDRNNNIDAGLKYLKKSLDATEGDPKMATIGYNAGINAPFFTGGNLPESTAEYVKKMRSYGAYDEPNNEAAVAKDAKEKARIAGDENAQERRMAQLGGAGVGLVINPITGEAGAATKVATSPITNALQAAGAAVQRGRQSAMPPAASVVPAPPQPVPMGVADAGRIPSSQTGSNPYNYAKSLGMTDIEAGRALDMTKEAGGAHDLATQRRLALNTLQGSGFAENPRYGGLMTQQPSAGGGPRQSFTFQPEGGLSSLPPSQPVSMAPKAASTLETVGAMFKGMMRPVGALASAGLKYAVPPLALASAAGEGVNIAQQMRKPESERDMISALLSGGNIIGSGLSMFPPTAPVGIPLMLGTGAAQHMYENRDKQNMPTSEEMMTKAFQY